MQQTQLPATASPMGDYSHLQLETDRVVPRRSEPLRHVLLRHGVPSSPPQSAAPSRVVPFQGAVHATLRHHRTDL